jgi:hypothetical protein
MNKKVRIKKAKMIAKKKHISLIEALNEFDKYNRVLNKRKRTKRDLGYIRKLKKVIK